MNKKKASFICFLVWFTGIILLIVADQSAKYRAAAIFTGTSGMTLITRVLELQYLENRGMAFGMLQGRQMLFLVLCIAFCAVMLWLFFRIPKTGYYIPLILAGGILTGGAAGKYIDRAFRGYVVDFIYVSLIDFPIFNLADIKVVSGGIALLILCLFHYR